MEMAGENVKNYFLTPDSGTDNALTITGTLTATSAATVTLGTATITTLNIGTGGKIKADAGAGTAVSNALTISKMAGVITTEALTTAGAGSQAIVLTNTLIAAGDIILLTLAGGTNTVKNITFQAVATANTGTITVYNNTAATALNGTLIINFLVIKTA